MRAEAAAASPLPQPVATDSVPASNAELPPASAPFHWSQVESTDYRQYIANLRAIGCPEPVIRDIIAADLHQVFAARTQAIWKWPQQAYWEKPRNDSADFNQRRQLAEISREESAAYQELLGVPLSQQAMIDAAFLQIHGSEHELLFLAPGVREAAMRALQEAGFEQRELESANRGPDDSALFKEKLEILAKVLTPEELDGFRLRNSWPAQQMKNELAYFDCTPEEFKTLLDAREKNPRTAFGNLADRKAATEQIRRLFGDERAKEFEKVSDILYINSRRPLEEQGLPVELADRAWQIASGARNQAEQLANNTALPAEERLRQVQALRDRAVAELGAVLGEKAARDVQRDLRVMMSVSESRLKR